MSENLFGADQLAADERRLSPDFGNSFGLLPREMIQIMRSRGMIKAEENFDDLQIQPASLDLRLGHKAYRVKASFLPGNARSVQDQIESLKIDEASLEGNGAVLERGGVYVVPLLELLNLPPSISAQANPKSSTGRLDVFVRLIADGSEIFDYVNPNYKGRLYAEISPRSFSVRVRKNSKLNQIRFRRLNSQQTQSVDFKLTDYRLKEIHSSSRLVDGNINLRNGLVLRVDLSGEMPERVVGYKAERYTAPVDVDKVNSYSIKEFWKTIKAQDDSRLILEPDGFYILASREKIHIPPDLAAEMVAIDPAMGEFRVHYAGFFDPGFGYSESGYPGARAVLEVRSHEVPFILEDGQVIGRLMYERMTQAPQTLYGVGGASNYQGQGLKLSKHFKVVNA